MNEKNSYRGVASSKDSLSKPFLLLAGVSGTGKTQFVKKQAPEKNYCLIPVRPDWHEPSDLLGYVSRIGSDGPRYVPTPVLKFMCRAWLAAIVSASSNEYALSEPLENIPPFWLCLDEMNLAPVEQYFADYLSVLETREWKDKSYTCTPLLKADTFATLDDGGRDQLKKDLGLDGTDPLQAGLWEYILNKGIPIPPNLIVAGTVNMDETTHGFSRKGIDRALTFDFGMFFPNNYSDFFEEDRKCSPVTLTFPVKSHASKDDLLAVGPDRVGDGTSKAIGFLSALKNKLDGTPFEIAYRALNELLLFVVCRNPADDMELRAIWDDFMMMKVLPRVEGDRDKLSVGDGADETVLDRIERVCTKYLDIFWDEGRHRPDLFRVQVSDGLPPPVECRTRIKLDWMKKRLTRNGFTSFWP
ncbi:MAG: restriction endonuclease [Planctomycetes bacterium]|nr:restriction endonuclease [Planctomycetota bacterium]